MNNYHRLLMPPHPGEIYQSSALCSCGDWQYDADSFSSLLDAYKDILRLHTLHMKESELEAIMRRYDLYKEA